jgi:hypothetical protein
MNSWCMSQAGGGGGGGAWFIWACMLVIVFAMLVSS